MFAQAYCPFDFPQELPESYQQDYSQLYQRLQTESPADLKKKYPRVVTYYSHYNAYFVSQNLGNGSTYPGWKAMEEYVNAIVAKVSPEVIKLERPDTAHIRRDANINASMMASGDFFINIGLIARVENEAALASVIAHEIAHYYKQHVLSHWIAREENFYHENSYGLFDFMEGRAKDRSAFSINKEVEADSLALVWMKDAGYDIKGAISLQRLLMREQKRRNRRYRSPLMIYYRNKAHRTHPLGNDRLKAISRFMERYPEHQGQAFIQSETTFLELQKQARVAALEAQMTNISYHECTEAAFRFHLLDPDNEAYVYYLMESIRRLAYFKPKWWKVNFFTSGYNRGKTAGGFENQPLEDSFFARFDPELLALSVSEMRQMPGRFYWEGDPFFKTNEEAFIFFSRVAEKMNCTECMLSNAISIDKDPALRKKYLKQYLGQPKALHREYAQALLKGTMYKALPVNKLLLIDDFEVVINQGQDDIHLAIDNSKDAESMDTLLNRLSDRYSNRTVLFLPLAKDTLLADYQKFLEMYRILSAYLSFDGKRVQLSEVDPVYWEMMKRYGVSEIEVVQCIYAEYRKKENSASAVEEAQSLSYGEVFGPAPNTRMLETYVYGYRECSVGRSVVIYYTKEQKLKSREHCIDKIETYLGQALVQKEALLNKPLLKENEVR